MGDMDRVSSILKKDGPTTKQKQIIINRIPFYIIDKMIKDYDKLKSATTLGENTFECESPN